MSKNESNYEEFLERKASQIAKSVADSKEKGASMQDTVGLVEAELKSLGISQEFILMSVNEIQSIVNQSSDKNAIKKMIQIHNNPLMKK